MKNSVPPEKSDKTASLRLIFQNPFLQKLEELKKILAPFPEGLPLKEAANQLGTSEDGIRTVVSSTKSQQTITIFLIQKGGMEEYYIKLTAK